MFQYVPEKEKPVQEFNGKKLWVLLNSIDANGLNGPIFEQAAWSTYGKSRRRLNNKDTSSAGRR